jgi:hypothetical protein
MIWIAAALFILLMAALHRVEHLDVTTGRRDGGNTYGSNRGWYWPWTPVIQVCFFGMIYCIIYGPAP